MMRRGTGFLRPAVAGALWVVAFLETGCAAAPALARLERLRAGATVLKAPQGVKGDFDVAARPPTIEFGILPDQWEGAKLWSAWGDAVWTASGMIYASTGDHASHHGHAYVYEIDPRRKTMRMVVDVTKTLGVPESRYAPGKIHAPLVDGGDGWLYFVTYRGSVRGTTVELGYDGDRLFRYNMASGQLENLGVMVPHSSVPSLEYHEPSKMLYGISVFGKSMPVPRDQFFAYDLRKRRLVYTCESKESANRALIVAPDGGAYFTSDGRLVRYDPKRNSATPLEVRVPGDGHLRAASRADASGLNWAISKNGVVFSFDTAEAKVKEYGPAFYAGSPYTAVCKVDPTGRYVYYVPSAHGGSSWHGSAVIQFDVETGRRKVIAFLNDYIRREKAYNLGGTYGLAVSPDGGRLFICWNGGPLTQKKNDFGLCSAMILGIPKSERRP